MKFHQGIMDTIEDLTNTNNGIVKQQHVGLTKKKSSSIFKQQNITYEIDHMGVS